MSNWEEKIESTKRIAEIARNKNCPFEVFKILKHVQKIDVQVSIIEKINGERKILQERLDELGTEIFEDYENNTEILEVKTRRKEGYKNVLKYSESLKELTDELEDKVVQEIDKWYENLKSDDLEIKDKRAIEKATEEGVCKEIINTLLEYYELLPEICELYESKMYEKNKESKIEKEFFKNYLSEKINDMNDVYYGNKGYA